MQTSLRPISVAETVKVKDMTTFARLSLWANDYRASLDAASTLSSHIVPQGLGAIESLRAIQGRYTKYCSMRLTNTNKWCTNRQCPAKSKGLEKLRAQAYPKQKTQYEKVKPQYQGTGPTEAHSNHRAG